QCSVSSSHQCVLDGDCRPPICASCGASETCVGTHYGYSSELHPPYATAAIRQGRGAVVTRRPGGRAVPATRVDVFVSPDAAGAGDRCILTHRDPDAALLGVECFPLAQRVATLNAQDFTFDVPLPPQPPGGRVKWRKVLYDTPGGVRAGLRVRRRL